MAEAPPVCVFCRRRPVSQDWQPFCSERCKLLDLAQWVDGNYRIAAAPAGDSEPDDPDDASTP